MSGCSHDKLRGALLLDANASFANHGHVLGEFGVPAAGQDRDDGKGWIEILLVAEFFAGLRRFDGADERMANEFCGHARATKECFFEGKNAERLRETAANDADSPRAPGPELWADVVDVTDSVRAEFAGEAKMKTGKVGENRERRAAALGFGNQVAHGAD